MAPRELNDTGPERAATTTNIKNSQIFQPVSLFKFLQVASWAEKVRLVISK